MISKEVIEIYLENAGIQLNGNQPYDVRIREERMFKKMLRSPSLCAGEAYMDGWWECDKLDEFFFRICQHRMDSKFYGSVSKIAWSFINAILNFQTKIGSLKVAKEHYDIGNELYSYMLGPSMAYTCGYWKEANTLDEAQFDKFDLICRKLNIKEGDSVLELGCGWGTFAKYAAEKYGCKVVCVNISKEQVKYAREISKNLPITVHQCDYRDRHIYNSKNERFDKVVTIGLCEHIGHKNYQNFAKIIRNNLKDDGLCLLHTIGKDVSSNHVDPWIAKYIFPNSILPSIKLLSRAFEDHFVVEDWHNFGADYDRTLMEWHANFVEHWDKVKHLYDERFFRKWEYYLLSCAGAFRARTMQLWQVILSPSGVIGGYECVR